MMMREMVKIQFMNDESCDSFVKTVEQYFSKVSAWQKTIVYYLHAVNFYKYLSIIINKKAIIKLILVLESSYIIETDQFSLIGYCYYFK